ncbi:BRO family protein [Salinicoccus roseus]|uniref:BRO family protein n=1 Tax=Salinicoccus roseus TaxID=45670 RepID=UPI0023000CFE|nr:ORF6C domain-containing protein [Salinicoccus roseus]
MDQLQVFNFNHQAVRTFSLNDEGWFCLIDVCDVLDLGNASQLKKRLKQDGVITNEVTDNLGRKQMATFVNEPNLYKVIFQSRKKEAEDFQDWVYEDVLPQIRKTGKYEAPKDPMEIMRLQFEALDQTNKKVKTIEMDVTYLKDEVKLDAGEYDFIGKHIRRNVMESIQRFGFVNTQEVKQALFKDINSGLNDVCGIKTRTQLRQKHFDQAMDYINVWVPSTATRLKVQQLTLEFADSQEDGQANV